MAGVRKIWPDDYQSGGNGTGTRCPECNCADTRKRTVSATHRTCRNCGRVFPTYERTAR